MAIKVAIAIMMPSPAPTPATIIGLAISQFFLPTLLLKKYPTTQPISVDVAKGGAIGMLMAPVAIAITEIGKCRTPMIAYNTAATRKAPPMFTKFIRLVGWRMNVKVLTASIGQKGTGNNAEGMVAIERKAFT